MVCDGVCVVCVVWCGVVWCGEGKGEEEEWGERRGRRGRRGRGPQFGSLPNEKNGTGVGWHWSRVGARRWEAQHFALCLFFSHPVLCFSSGFHGGVPRT